MASVEVNPTYVTYVKLIKLTVFSDNKTCVLV